MGNSDSGSTNSDSESTNVTKHPFTFVTIDKRASEEKINHLKDWAYNYFVSYIEHHFKDISNCIDINHARCPSCQCYNRLLLPENISKVAELVSNIAVKDKSYNKECLKQKIGSGFTVAQILK